MVASAHTSPTAIASMANALADEYANRMPRAAGGFIRDAVFGLSHYLREDLRSAAIANDTLDVLLARALWAVGLDVPALQPASRQRAAEDARRLPAACDPLLLFCVSAEALRSVSMEAASGRRIWILDLPRLNWCAREWRDPMRWPMIRRVIEGLVPTLQPGGPFHGLGLEGETPGEWGGKDARPPVEGGLDELRRYAQAVLERAFACRKWAPIPDIFLLRGN